MWDPVTDIDAAATLGDALRDVGYDGDAIEELLGEDGVAADRGDAVPMAMRLGDDELSTTVKLLLLNRPAPAASFPAARELLALGLATTDGDLLVPRARIVPTEDVLLTFDTFSQGEGDPDGWVASFSPTAYWLASITPRRHAKRALDIGTGNGVHALLAAAHSDHVIATDVNARALAFTDISAALNGIDNVETRLGSLFDPVAGEEFDLITSNAPYVISPERKWQYRDAGFHADNLSRSVVTGAAAHLAEGGFAAVLVSWLAEDEDDPDAHVYDWLDANGCDAWILGMSGSDPIDHAAGWMEHLETDPEAYAKTIEEWAEYFEELGAAWVSEGGVVMRKRTGTRNHIRADSVDEDELEFASDQIERVFAVLEQVAEHGPDAVLERRMRLAPDVTFEQELDRSGAVTSTTILLDEGTCPEVEIDLETAEVLTALDGATTLDQAVQRVVRREELSKREAVALRSDVRRVVRDLLEMGVLELV